MIDLSLRLSISVCLLLTCSAPALLAAHRNPLATPGRELSAHPGWLKLLHYRRTPFGALESEVDDPAFFLAQEGKSDPAAELQATLDALRLPPGAHPEEHARCRFPARAAWLQAALDLPAGVEPACARQQAFLAEIEGSALSLVYAANSLDHPASALGHSFLLLKPKDTTQHAGTAIDYRAHTDTDNPLLYAFKGLTGLFVGRFELQPEREKLWSLLEDQGRDLWEFELRLGPDELSLFRLHLWELSHASIDYYYLTENCSYHALSALEAAAPRLALVEQTKFVVLPIDTVHALFRVPGLVTKVSYFPSKTTRALDARGAGPTTPPLHSSTAPELRKVERSHGPMRFSFGSGGSTSRGAFASLGFRLSLHDLLDPPVGNPALLQIQMLSLTARYSPLPSSFTVDEVTFIDLFALNTLDSPSPWAWRVRAFGDRLRDAGCASEDCFVHGLDLGLGSTLATRDRALSFFVLATSSAVFSDDLQGVGGSFVRWTLGPHVGVRARIGSQLVALLSARYHYLPWQALGSSFDLTGQLRLSLAQHVAIGIESRAQPSSAELGLTSFLYF